MSASSTLRLTIAILAAVLLMAIVPVLQSTRAAGPSYVAPGGSDSNSCSSPAAPCATINGAIGKASSGDTLLIATGIYTGTGDQVVLLNKSATLSGGWNSTFTAQGGTSTIDAEQSRRGIKVNMGVNGAVDRFTIIRGNAVQDGVGEKGAGIYNDGSLVVNNSRLSENYTSWLGSAIFNTGVLTLSHGTVANNTTPTPGGFAAVDNRGMMAISDSTISGNVGDGVTNYQATITINNSSVSNNTTSGILNLAGGILTLNNSTVSGNAYSGLLASVSTSTVLNNSTVTGNTTPSDGGGIINDGTLTIQNTIVAGNRAEGNGPDCYGAISSGGYNLMGNTSGCSFSPGTGDLTNVDARLGVLIGAPGTATYHPLLPGSPAINAGNPSGCIGSTGPLITDQRGAPRSGRCDIGAYEYVTPSLPVGIYALSGSSQRAGPLRTFTKQLEAVVLDGIGSPVNNITGTFSAPASGASGMFSNTHTFTEAVTTDASGVATASPLVANQVMGSYTVTAQVGSIITTADFALANFAWYVSSDGDNNSSCLSPGATCATINGVLNKPDFLSQDTILAAGGIYTGTGDQVVLLDRSVTVSGGWDSTFAVQNGTTIVNGERVRRGVVVGNGVTVILDHFTIQNGSGSGIANYGTLTFNHSTIKDSVAEIGGGGLYNQGTATLNNSAVIANTTTAITGMGGGGIYNTVAKLTLNNSTVSGNATAARGGGILSFGALSLNSSTISGNSAQAEGGGVQIGSGSPILQNTIAAKNIAGAGPDCSGMNLRSAGYNLIGTLSGCTFTSGTGDLININPRLFPLTGSPGYHRLLRGSPAINAGNPSGCTDSEGNPLDFDQRGGARVGRCDIGAYEYDPNNDPLTYVFLPTILRK